MYLRSPLPVLCKSVSYTHLDVYKRQGGAGAGVIPEGVAELAFQRGDEGVGGGGGAELGGVGDGQRQAGELSLIHI